MKPSLLISLLVGLLVLFSTSLSAQLENFEGESGTTFSVGGNTYTLNGDWGIDQFENFGCPGVSGVTNTYIDTGFGDGASAGNTGGFTITSGAASFQVATAVDFCVFAGINDGLNVANPAMFTIIGTKTDNTTISQSYNIPGNSSSNFSVIQFAAATWDNMDLTGLTFRIDGPTTGNVLDYLAIDNFVFADAGNTAFSVADASVVEGNAGTTNIVFTVTRTNNIAVSSVQIATADGSAVAPSDYTANSATLNFAAGGPLTQTFTVAVNGDTDLETDETFFVNLSNPGGAGTIAPGQGQAVGTIVSDDGTCEDFEGETLGGTTFSEGGLNFSLTGGMDVAVDAAFPEFTTYAETETASTGSGLSLVPGQGQVFVPAFIDIYAAVDINGGLANGSLTITGTLEGGGTLTATQSFTGTGGIPGNPYFRFEFTGTPLENQRLTALSFAPSAGLNYLAIDNFKFEALPENVVSVSVNTVSQAEGNVGPSTFTFTLTRSDNTTAFDVDVDLTDLTATAGTDFVAQPTVTISFAANGSLTQTYSVTVNGDDTPEGNETFTVALSNATNGAQIIGIDGIGVIQDDDSGCEDFEGDGPDGSTSFSQAGATFSTTGELIVASFDQNGGGNGGSGGSQFYLESTAANAPHAGNVGTISLDGGCTFTMTGVDIWTSSDGDINTQESGTVRFTGTLAAGGTAFADLTTGNSGGDFTQNLLFAGTALEGESLTSLSIELLGNVDYVAIDNFKFVENALEVTLGTIVASCGDNGSFQLTGLEATIDYQISYTDPASTAVGPLAFTTDAAGSLIVTGLAPGSFTNVTVTEDTPGGCATSSFNITVPANPSADPAMAGDDQEVCLATTATLAANTPADGIGMWTTASGATITDPTNPATTVTDLPANTASTFTWTVTPNGGCPATMDDVIITTGDTEAPTVASSPGIACGETIDVVTSLDYIYTTASPTSGGTGAQNCWAGIALRSPAIMDNCGVDSVAITFQAAGGTTPSEIPTTREVGGDAGPIVYFDANSFVIPSPSIQFYAGTGGPATTQVTFTVFDSVGLSNNTCSYFITVTDDQPATAICKNDTVFLDANGMATLPVDSIDNGSSDNCSLGTLSLSQTMFECGDVTMNESTGANTPTTVTLTVPDAAGNTPATCDAMVTVRDTISPVLTCQNATINLDGTGVADFSFDFVQNNVVVSATDICNAPTLGISRITEELGCDDVGTFSLFVTIRDPASNVDSCTVTITVADPTSFCNQPPVAECQPVMVDANGDCMATAVAADFDDGSTDPDGDAITLSIEPTGPFGLGITTVELIVSDGMLNDTCETTITVTDNTPPTITCRDTTIALDATGLNSIEASLLTMSSDNCSATTAPVDVTYNCDSLTFAGPAREVEVIAIDASGNADTCTVNVTVIDTLEPVITCRDTTIALDATGLNSIEASLLTMSSDNCSATTAPVDVTYNCDSLTFAGPAREVEVISVDASGNADTCTVNVTVIDTLAPAITCRDTTIALDATGLNSIEASLLTMSSDNCSATTAPVDVTYNCDSLTFAGPARMVDVIAIDASGNADTCTVNVTVIDTLAPVITCRDTTIALDATGLNSIEASLLTMSSDNCSATTAPVDVTYNCDSLTFAGPAREVEVIAIDASGNADTCTVNVTVIDTLAPVITCRDTTIALDATGLNSIEASLLTMSSDNCSATTAPVDVTYNCDSLTFAGPAREVEVIAVDASGNADTCTVNVMVIDTLAPIITCRDTTIALDATGLNSIEASLLTMSSDNCSATTAPVDVTYNCDSLTFAGPAREVEVISVDASGNADTCTVNVTVIDTLAPVITCRDTTIALDATGLNSIEASLLTMSSDNCSATTAPVDVTYNCDSLTFAGPAREVEVISVDASGNADTCTVNVTVIDTLAPVITCRDTTIALDATGLNSIEASLLTMSSDNCSATTAPVDVTYNCDSLTFAGPAREVEVISIDASGNADTCTVNVTVIDTIAPTVECLDVEVFLDANGGFTATPESFDNGTVDACGIADISFLNDPADETDVSDDLAVTCAEVGESMVTILFTDTSGNTASCTQTLTVTDTVKAVITVTSQIITLNSQGDASLILDQIASATDACGVDTLVASRPLDFGCEDIGNNVITITATDVNGNVSMEEVIVTVLFTEPDLGCVSEINVTLDENCEAQLIPEMLLAGNTVCLDQIDFEVTVSTMPGTDGEIDGCGRFIYTITEVENPDAPFTLDRFTSCWGYVNAEDKTSPVAAELPTAPAELFCSELDDVNINTLPANVSRCFTVTSGGVPEQGAALFLQTPLGQKLAAGGGLPTFTDGCSNITICVNDIVAQGDACSDVVITRIFTARDGDCTSASGEANAPTVVSYDITFTRPSIADVMDVPGLAEFSCEDFEATSANPQPEANDYPFLLRANGDTIFLGASFCNIGATFQDGPRITTCENTYKFLRTYTVIDWCDVSTIETFTQLVKVGDFTAPTLTAPTQDLNFDGVADDGPLFYSTNSQDCTGFFVIPSGAATDNCDATPTVSAVVYAFGDLTSTPIGPFNVGELAGGFPVGTHSLVYTASDDCDNTATLPVQFTIGDRTAPVAICEDGLNISIGGGVGANGDSPIRAEDIDRASRDECGAVSLAISRDGVNFFPTLTLDCDDISAVDANGDPIADLEITLQVTDGSGNVNQCWLNVVVEDKAAPICIAPTPLAFNCAELDGEFPDDLDASGLTDEEINDLLDNAFGVANGVDNCPTTTITQSYVDNRTDCGTGTITRTFTVTDAQGLTSPQGACRQTITIIGIHDYTIVFPADAENSECVEPDYNDVTFEERGCDLITVATDIDTFSATADECFKLRITYEVLNWCEYDTESDAYFIPRDADNDNNLNEATYLHVIPRDETTLGDDLAFLDRDNNRTNNTTIGNLDTGDGGILAGSDAAGYGQDGSRGAYVYQQFIKVYDDTAPTLDVDGSVTEFCDLDGDCIDDATLTFTVDDVCSPTAVNATVTLDAFINAGSDDIYTLADFVADGGNVTGSTTNANGTFTTTLADLPTGTHAIRVVATDGCGNTAVDLIVFTINDCKAPTPICINGLTATLMPDGNGGGMAAIWSSDFIASPSEDCSGEVKFAIYRSDDAAAANFAGPNPGDVSLELTCDDLGMLPIRIYAIDPLGNADYCETTLFVQAHNETVCTGPAVGVVAGLIATPNDELMSGVEVNITDNGSMNDLRITDAGLYSFAGLALGEDYTVQPVYDPSVNLANVSTGDLITISRHILGLAEMTNAYQLLAGDVTQDNNINVVDIIAIRRVILGLDNGFTATNSWRFYTEAGAEVFNANNLNGNITDANFAAIEMGNVNDLFGARASFGLNIMDQAIEAGNVYEVAVSSADMAGFQGTLELAAGLELVNVNFTGANTAFNLNAAANGLIAVSHVGATDAFTLEVRATVSGQLSELISVSDRMTVAEAYNAEGAAHGLNINFGTTAVTGTTFELGQNSPNPFAASTMITFELPTAATATLTVQDIQGRVIMSREIDAAAGTNTATLKSNELKGTTGVLTYTLTAGDFTATRKMVVQ